MESDWHPVAERTITEPPRFRYPQGPPLRTLHRMVPDGNKPNASWIAAPHGCYLSGTRTISRLRMSESLVGCIFLAAFCPVSVLTIVASRTYPIPPGSCFALAIAREENPT